MVDLVEYLRQQIPKETNRLIASAMRKDMIKAIINNYPEGAVIATKEIRIALTGLSTTGFLTMMQRMIIDGHITKEQVSPGGPSRYKVLIPGNTYDKERGLEETVTPVEKEDRTLIRSVIPPNDLIDVTEEEDILDKSWTFEELEALAMKFQFYWGNSSMLATHFLERLKVE